MPFNISRSAQFYDKEVLAYPQPQLLAKSVVLDANAFPVSTASGRYVVPAGTVLKLSTTLSTRYVEYNGAGRVEGVLTRAVDLLAQATAGNEPAAMFFHEAVFATTAIVGFTTYASAIVSTMNTCKFV